MCFRIFLGLPLGLLARAQALIHALKLGRVRPLCLFDGLLLRDTSLRSSYFHVSRYQGKAKFTPAAESPLLKLGRVHWSAVRT